MRRRRGGIRGAGDGAVYRIAPPGHTKHAAEGRFQCGKTEMKTRTVRCEKILPSLPAEGRGTRVSRILRGATQVQRGLPSLVCRLFRGGVRRFRRGAPYTRARRMSFAPAAAGSFQQLLPSLTGVRRYCFRVIAGHRIDFLFFIIIRQSRSPRCSPRISISAEARLVAQGTL